MHRTGKQWAAALAAGALLLGLTGCSLPFGETPAPTPGPMEPANARQVGMRRPESGTSIDNTQKNQ